MQKKIRSVRVHKAMSSIELGIRRRMLFDKMTWFCLIKGIHYRACVYPRMNRGVWKGCRQIEAEQYRQEKSW